MRHSAPPGPLPDAMHPETQMIEALKSDAIVDKVGGRFKLCTLIQRRLVQLMDGARPLVERNGRSDLELVIAEIMEGKIELDFVGLPGSSSSGDSGDSAALPG